MRFFLFPICAICLCLSVVKADVQQSFSLSELVTLSTVRIEVVLANGMAASGTGFFYNFLQDKDGRGILAIVTNKHVIRGAVRGEIHLNRADANGNYVLGSFESVLIEDCEKKWVPHPADDVDLAILLIGPFLNEQQKDGKRFCYMALNDGLIPTDADKQELTAIEDITMVGYPDGIWDDKNNRPIVRRGITATQLTLDYRGKPEFLIDAACFPGSSGSPVYLLNQGSYATRSGTINMGTRFKFVGVLSSGPQHLAVGEIQSVPMANRTISVSMIPNNLGIVIKSERLREFEPLLKALVDKEAQNKTP